MASVFLDLPHLLVKLMTEKTLEAVQCQGKTPLEIATAIDLPSLLPLREKTVLQSTNRKLERRVKELSIQIDDERQHVNDQKDQVRT